MPLVLPCGKLICGLENYSVRNQKTKTEISDISNILYWARSEY
jgi:hypothetical protein